MSIDNEQQMAEFTTWKSTGRLRWKSSNGAFGVQNEVKVNGELAVLQREIVCVEPMDQCGTVKWEDIEVV